jgi:hypothetical protein
MTKVTLDEALRAKLNGLGDEVEICDADGQPVGYFVPAARYTAVMTERKWHYDYVMKKCPISDEELERRRREEKGKGRTLAEIWKDLGVQ